MTSAFETTFIDWVSMGQRHSQELPIVSNGVRLAGSALDCIGQHEGKTLALVEMGEKGRYSLPSYQHKGSHSTSVFFRSDGHNVSLSGNPGRLDRPDNVWNYGIPETVLKANDALATKALPGFTPGECRTKASVTERDRDLGLWHEWTGAVFREMHVTRNFASGNDALSREVIRHFHGQRAARLSKGVFGEETVVFGELAKKDKPLHRALVCYRKAEEMLAHAKGPDAKARVKASQEYQFARDVGLVRIEEKWGRHFLRDHGLRFLGDASMPKIIRLFEAQTAFLLDASPDRAARVVSEMPAKLRLAALAWIRGDDLRLLQSRATFFRTVKALRDYGIDASEPRNVAGRPNTEEALQRMLDALPRFDLKPLPVPEWYGLPEVRKAA